MTARQDNEDFVVVVGGGGVGVVAQTISQKENE